MDDQEQQSTKPREGQADEGLGEQQQVTIACRPEAADVPRKKKVVDVTPNNQACKVNDTKVQQAAGSDDPWGKYEQQQHQRQALRLRSEESAT